jgi:hypothetical protein
LFSARQNSEQIFNLTEVKQNTAQQRIKQTPNRQKITEKQNQQK